MIVTNHFRHWLGLAPLLAQRMDETFKFWTASGAPLLMPLLPAQKVCLLGGGWSGAAVMASANDAVLVPSRTSAVILEV